MHSKGAELDGTTMWGETRRLIQSMRTVPFDHTVRPVFVDACEVLAVCAGEFRVEMGCFRRVEDVLSVLVPRTTVRNKMSGWE
jgi:hypothetical protein